MASDTEPAKLLLPYLQRADELQKHEPLVAYYCRLYAMEKGLRIPPKERTKTTNSLLVSLMNQLEKDKKTIKLGPEDNLYVEGFASNVFARADKQDRAGRADLNTAKTFYAASIFFETLTQFGEQPPDIEQKQKYAIWKAADIRKALKEGRKPEPGPPGGDEDLLSPSSTTPNTYDLGPNNIPTIPQGTDTFPRNVDKLNLQPPVSPPYSSPDHPSGDFMPACPKTESPPHNYGKTTHQQPYSTGHQSMPQNYPSNDDPQNYHPHDTVPHDNSSQDPNIYHSHDGTPQSYSSHDPPQNYSSHETFPQNYPSYETSSQNYPSHEGSFPPNSYPNFQSFPSFNDSALPPSPGHYPSHYQGSDSAHIQQTTPLNRIPTVQYNPGGGTQTVSTPPPAANYTYDSNYQPSVEKIAEAHKAARFAVGALAFDDVPVAVDFLQRSLELLTNPSAKYH